MFNVNFSIYIYNFSGDIYIYILLKKKQVLPSDLFPSFKGLLRGLSDLHLGIKGTSLGRSDVLIYI